MPSVTKRELRTFDHVGIILNTKWVQIPAPDSPGRLHFLQWKLVYVGTQYGNVWEGKSAETFWSSLVLKTNRPAVTRATCILPKVLTLVSLQDVQSSKLRHASKYVITNGKTPMTNFSKNSSNLFQLWFKSYRMSFPQITNFRQAFYSQKFRSAAVNSLCMKRALQNEVHSQQRSVW
jgi:hypothetical protein